MEKKIEDYSTEELLAEVIRRQNWNAKTGCAWEGLPVDNCPPFDTNEKFDVRVSRL